MVASVIALIAVACLAFGASPAAAAEPPQVSNLNSRNLQATSAELLGEVDPNQGETTWYFEFGPTAAYGAKAPVGGGNAGLGESPVPVSTKVAGLAEGVTYHFRLVATNQYGTSVTPDQTFGFYPANCPNAQVRQETRSTGLPDCRAYELVTPKFAQGAIIFPLGGTPTPFATSPAKLSYGASFGTFPEETGDPSNYLADLYVSTRSDTGWYQKFIGVPASETLNMGGPPRSYQEQPLQAQFGPSRMQLGVQSNPSLSEIADYNDGFPDFAEQKAPNQVSNAPYIWNTSTGKFLERWPSNLSQVPNGLRFVGTPEISADWNHFVFQSNLVFAPGGTFIERTIGCCANNGYPQAPPASIYDDNLENGHVLLASVKADNTSTFEGYVYNISKDGSHILMNEERSTPATIVEPPGVNDPTEIKGPFYLRVDADRTYEIGAGHNLAYIGSTADGKTAYFRSAEQLSSEDKDQSADLYAWHESEPNSLQLISIGDHGEAGNTDECPGWPGGGCSIETINFIGYSGVALRGVGFNGGQGGNGMSDQAIASDSGDIYFISPEQLLEGKGVPGKANLYLWRKGTLRFVTALAPEAVCSVGEFETGCSDGPVARMQVTPDGDHMAFVVNSQITSYNNAGKTEMYTYEPESGQIVCASCRPDGQPPVGDVYASQNGLFQTYDGRVFFTTEDPLVARDTNEVQDVYEYTEGRAQLITAGTGMVLKGYNGYGGTETVSGVISVSANGTDLYFNTYDSLVSQDHNGPAFKIYDARTGGGFPAEVTPEVCESADECHGAGAEPSALPPDRTSSSLGNGNVPKAKPKKHHKKKHHKKESKAAGKKGKGKGKGGNHHG